MAEIGIRYTREFETDTIAAVFLGDVLGRLDDRRVLEDAINRAEAENMLFYWTLAMQDEAWMRLQLAALLPQ